MDSGYFYCPYVPLTQTPVVLDPESFCPRKGILTRYGKKLLEGRFEVLCTSEVMLADNPQGPANSPGLSLFLLT
jgi:hypothetical protein